MKQVLKYIVAGVCFCALFFTPSEDAPLRTYLVWIVVELCALFAFCRFCKSEDSGTE